MAGTPPPPTNFPIPPMPRLSTRPRGSINTSFSFGPQSLVNSYIEANSSTASALDPNRSILQVSPLRPSPRGSRKVRESGGRHPLANDTTDIFQDSLDVTRETGDNEYEEKEREWGMIDRMRLWRHDALMQHLFDSAAFWGDKILSWTNDPNDAFWLAQTFFMTHQYARAEQLLIRAFPMPVANHDVSKFPLTNGHAYPLVQFSTVHPNIAALGGKGKGKETDSFAASLHPIRVPVGPGSMMNAAVEYPNGASRLVDMSVACRYLAALCQVRQGKWHSATEMLGESNPFRDSGKSGPAVPNVDGGIKVEASMCHLRGIVMLKLNRSDQAKQCFLEALALDVKCYDSFEQLVNGEMMSADEEWDFIQGLSYKDQAPEDADFIRLIYTSRLRKYKHTEEQALTRKRLVEEFGLSDNPDVLYSFADALYTQFRWADCFALTSRILGLVAIHPPTVPMHIACMYHLSHLHSKLFILAHEMVDKEPENAVSWYAVGTWYLTAKKWQDARTYLSKATLMDPRSAPAWIAFAHTFALEGEHDHAVTAYSTCSRLFPGSHLPLLFIGMEQMMLSHLIHADEALEGANAMCDVDPLLINERGVLKFYNKDFESAITLFEQAIELAKVTQTSQTSWVNTFNNLGTAYRRVGRLTDARDTFKKVIVIEPRNVPAITSLGIVYQLLDDPDNAILKYHEALSINPVNGQAIELLNISLEATSYIKPKDPMNDPAWVKSILNYKSGSGQPPVVVTSTADTSKNSTGL